MIRSAIRSRLALEAQAWLLQLTTVAFPRAAVASGGTVYLSTDIYAPFVPLWFSAHADGHEFQVRNICIQGRIITPGTCEFYGREIYALCADIRASLTGEEYHIQLYNPNKDTVYVSAWFTGFRPIWY